MSYGNYLQPDEGVYIDTLTAKNLNNGQGRVTAFRDTGTTLSGVNISNWNYNIQVLVIGQEATLAFNSPVVSCTADQDIQFFLPYPFPVSRLNVNSTTAFGEFSAIFNDANGTSYAGQMVSDVAGVRYITGRCVSPAGCSNCTISGRFSLNLA